MEIYFTGVIIAICTFLIIGLCHPLFGAVITLREINGINRIQEFVRACTFRGWIVNEVNVQNQIEVYNVSQEEIRFD